MSLLARSMTHSWGSSSASNLAGRVRDLSGSASDRHWAETSGVTSCDEAYVAPAALALFPFLRKDEFSRN